ncbi:MAG: hypothetical protein IJK50_03370 [Prevotella sp.]|nr:hypothetical protein [Prevotella sp.]
MRKVAVIIVSLLLCFVRSSAQGVELKGTVVNADDGSAVPFANIMVYSLPDSTLLGYAISSDNGTFSVGISPSVKDLFIKVSCLGFKGQTITTTTGADSLLIRLEPDSKMLETVVVKGRAPGIKVSGDTIDYNIRKYTTGNEKVLKDILAKLPGMDVDEKGQVTVNGEAVKKILIDGQDFFGNQNEQITNNLPANVVDKIQLQKNYSEFSLLNGFNTRRANALNVQIDSLHRGRLTGNAELLGGWPNNYRGTMNAYSFGSKAMLGFNAKYFNTGEEIMTLMDYIKLLGSVNDYARSFGGQDRVIDNGVSLPSFLSNNINSYKRRNALLSSNIAWNPNERLKLNAYYMFNFEASRGQYDIDRTYMDTDKAESFSETSDTKRRFHHFGLNLKYMLPNHAALDSRTTVTAMPQTSYRHIDDYDTEDRLQEWDISHRMSLVKNWNNRNLLSLSGELGYHNRHRHLQVESDGSLYDLPENIHFATQKQRQSLLDAQFIVSWSHRFSKVWQMDMSGGWNLIRHGVSADASLDRFNVSAQSLTTNVYDYAVSFSKKKGLLRLNSGLTLASVNSRYDDNRIVLLPEVGLELAFSSTNSVSLSYSSSYEADDDVFVSGAMMDDYRQYTVFSGHQNILHRKDRLRFGVNYFDILRDFTFIMNMGCSFTDKPYIADYQNTGRGVAVSLLRADRSNRTQYAYFNIKKGFRVPLILTFKSTATNSLYQTVYQHILSNNRSSVVDGSLALATKFKSLFNMEVGYKLTLQQSKIGISDHIINYAEHEIYMKPMLFRKEHFELSVPLSFALDHSGPDEFQNFDLGLSAMYSLKRWTFTIEGRNMLHTRTYRRLRIESKNDYNEIITENRQPGYVIAGAKYIF